MRRGDKMMYEVLVEGVFTARHGVRMPDGRVEPSHAHDWGVTVRFTGLELEESGLLVDFETARRDLDAVLANLHQTDLNEAPTLRGLNPTAEQVAMVIFERLLQRRGQDPRLQSVRVTEAPGCAAGYGREDAAFGDRRD